MATTSSQPPSATRKPALVSLATGAGLMLAFHCVAQADEPSLLDYLQVGSRIQRGEHTDSLEVQLIAAPEIRLYAAPKTTIQAALPAPASITVPAAIVFRMLDGTRHDVYAGRVLLMASYPKGRLRCDEVVRVVVTAQGCTASICFAPEQIPITARTESC